MPYRNWRHVPAVQVHAWCKWTPVSPLINILRDIHSNSSVATKRKRILQDLNDLRSSIIVGPTTRFPEENCMLNIDDPAFVAILNQMRLDFDYQTAYQAKWGNSEVMPKEAMQLYSEGVKRFYDNLNALQTYVYSPNNVWNREKFEKHNGLEWV